VPLALTAGDKLGYGLVAGAFILFALATSMLIPRFRPDFPGGNGVRLYALVAGVFFVGTLSAMFVWTKEDEHEAEAAAEVRPGAEAPPAGGGEEGGQQPAPPPSPTPSAPSGEPAAGKVVFTQVAGCGSCHTLADAGSTGTVGPNLDEAKPSFDLVVERVTNGKAPMPSFKGQLSPKQIEDVAAYVVQATSG
jgi:mono/diheme cytochrome c family protein